MKRLLITLCLAALIAGCGKNKRDAIGRTEVVIETSEGDITVRLYDDTPLHRENFISNARAGIYDDILFNRIVPEMVVQAGDTSLHAGRQTVGKKEPASDWIDAEIIYPRHFHKQGALAAAREPDSINPGRASSHLQWYIVTGKKYSSAELRELQALLYEGRVASLFETLQRQHAAELDSLKATNHASWQLLLNTLQVQAEESVAANPPQPFTDAQKQTYSRIGGAPHLDGEYTVFGEVVDGLPIALRIGRTPVDAKERPRRPIVIKRVIVNE